MRKSNGADTGVSLDPRTKLFLISVFTILVFIVDTLPVASLVMAAALERCRAAGIPLKKVFPHARLLAGLIALVIILQALFGKGIFSGLMVGCRVITLAALMPLLTLTTDAKALALGLTRLGLPYRAAFIITSTLNLVPSFEEEARLIGDARRLRGMESPRLREYPALVLPLMIKALRKAQLAGLAMDARAFGAYKTRTWLYTAQFSPADYWAFANGIAAFAVAITANIFVKQN